MTKKNYLQDRFFVSKRNFTTKHVKIVKKYQRFPEFLKIFVQNSGFFLISQIPGFSCLNCQIPGISRFPGKLATLVFSLQPLII